MKQLIIRRMTATDLVCNIYYKLRFWFYRNFLPQKFTTISFLEKKGWDLTFEDDFSQVSWSKDEKKQWRVGPSWGAYHPDYPFTYYGPPEIVKSTSCAKFSVQHDPKLFFNKDNDPVHIPFRKSMITTTHGFTQTYGRFECRCQIPFDRGSWPAFWLWGVTDNKYSEIDIFELYGGKDGEKAGLQEINLHFGESMKTPYETMRSWKVKIDKKSKINFFHEFVMEWSPEKIEMFTDGVKIFRYSRKKVLDKWFSSPLWIVQNHSVDPQHVDKNDKDYYSEYLVDYVRAYKRKS